MEEDIFNDEEKGRHVETLFTEFLQTYDKDRPSGGIGDLPRKDPYYVQAVALMRRREMTTLPIDFNHILLGPPPLQMAIAEEFLRFEPNLRKAAQRFIEETLKELEKGKEGEHVSAEFRIAFYNIPLVKKLRDLSTTEIGKLVAVSGVVTRTSEVRPELLFGSFKCLDCGAVFTNVEQQFKYTQPVVCTNATCPNRERWALLRQESKFGDWQRVRMQENSGEIPAGSLPRSLDIILRHEIVEQARAGDKCVFTGSVVVIPDIAALCSPGERAESRKTRDSARRSDMTTGSEGLRGIKAVGARDLSYRLAFLANSVKSIDAQSGVDIRGVGREHIEEEQNDNAQEYTEEVERMRLRPDIYDRLVESVAPTVFGHPDIKRAILLMLLGGVHKQTQEGINLRGDINVCIVGDPSCAKSQFLKYVAGFLPRAVYTSGKSSSAAGLTASVVKEPETGEFCIEAGALMLADNGICCIDEFDKMDIKDQVAIHEAMEQQTISITKAGIQATLNARTSILAAANPAGGRYDKSKPLKYNVALPPAILSRFDIVHVMVDEPDETMDTKIADHIVNVHKKKDDAINVPFTKIQLQRYIAIARALKPQLTEEANTALAEAYVALRRGDAVPGSQVAYRITVRQLEALVRLSEAIARAHLEDTVKPSHVKAARRLLSTSIISVDTNPIDLEDPIDKPSEGRDHEMGDPPIGSDLEPANGTVDDSKVVLGEGGVAGRGVDEQAKKLKVTYEKLQKVTRALVMHLQQLEDSGAVSSGLRQQDLVNWYVSLLNDQGAFSNLPEMAEEYRLVRAIVQHLVSKEGVLIVLDDGVAAAESLQKAAEDAERGKTAGEASQKTAEDAEGGKTAGEGSEKTAENAEGGKTAGEGPQRKPQILAMNERILAVNPNYTLD